MQVLTLWLWFRYAVRGDDSSEKERQQKEETAKNAMAFVEKYM